MVHDYMNHVMNNAEESVRRVIQRLSDGEFEYEMDFGAKIKVAITVHPESRAARHGLRMELQRPVAVALPGRAGATIPS